VARGLFVVSALLLATSCAKPPPPPPPSPPAFEAVPTAPQEALEFEGRTRPVGGGAQAVEIFVNGRPVLRGTLSERSPRDTFHAEFDGHDLVADCTLALRVQCAISVDGESQGSAMR